MYKSQGKLYSVFHTFFLGLIRRLEFIQVRSILEKLIKSDDKIFEIGIGNGFYSRLLKAMTHKGLHLNDISTTSLDFPCTFYKGDFSQIEISEKFNIVASFGVVEYIHDHHAFFHKINSILAPSGKIVMMTINQRNILSIFYFLCSLIFLGKKLRFLDEKELLTSGLKIEKKTHIFPHNHLLVLSKIS